ncbi:4355_t:CDS:1, partial [Gigaspora margarita]
QKRQAVLGIVTNKPIPGFKFAKNENLVAKTTIITNSVFGLEMQ